VRWREHDDDDRLTAVLLILCLDCSDRLIEKHPRLYTELDKNEPWPGGMAICIACRHREGLDCRHPDLEANGGPGLKIMVPQPMTGFLDYQDKRGRRSGRTFMSYPHEPRECAGRVRAPRPGQGPRRGRRDRARPLGPGAVARGRRCPMSALTAAALAGWAALLWQWIVGGWRERELREFRGRR
jgi:hypothetical protein